MKFAKLIIVFTFTLTEVNAQKIESSNSKDSLQSLVFDLFQKKIEVFPIKTEQLEVLEYLVKLINVRQKQIEDETKTNQLLGFEAKTK